MQVKFWAGEPKSLQITSAGQSAILFAMAKRKNPNAVGLGRRRAALAAPGEMSKIGKVGGTVGGPARAAKLTKAERQEIARKAAAARWVKTSGRGKRKGSD